MLSSREDVVTSAATISRPWLFVAPAAIIFAVYVVIPIFQSFWLSLFDWDGITVEKQFIGLGNYERLFQDEQFWTSLRNNVYWLIFFLLGPVGGVAIALFLNQQFRGMRLVKSLFFFPFVLSQVVIGLVFSWFYDPEHGILNAGPWDFRVPAVRAAFRSEHGDLCDHCGRIMAANFLLHDSLSCRSHGG